MSEALEAEYAAALASASSSTVQNRVPDVTRDAAIIADVLQRVAKETGDERFEKLAKKAFWAVWERRSGIGLIGKVRKSII
ncbi:hypothetical protein EON66_07675, partial [archaeon]